MHEALANDCLVPYDGSFRVADAKTRVSNKEGRKALKKRLGELTQLLEDRTRMLYADDRYAMLLVFQAMDAAGKDSTIRAVLTGVNPAQCQVFSFKKPSSKELDHDFLWRTVRCLPERGRIGIFNRSYYEEVLVVKVHPEILKGQRLPETQQQDQLWQQRFESIRDHEKHLARNGTVILKFWLNVSQEEQRLRFLSRLERPDKHWKFSAGDVEERQHWPEYMEAYEKCLNATSQPWAPWYAIPADSKAHMQVQVAEIILGTLQSLPLRYPVVESEVRKEFKKMHTILTDRDTSSR